MVRQVEHPRKTGAGGEIFVPGAIRALRLEQIFDPMMQAPAGGITSGNQTGDSPSGLGWGARRRCERAIIITGAAFTPASIGILDGAQPFAGAQHMRLAIILAGGAQAAQCEAGPVDVRHAPPPVPAAIGLLRAYQIIDAAPHGGMT